jgi:hypothetical protein
MWCRLEIDVGRANKSSAASADAVRPKVCKSSVDVLCSSLGFSGELTIESASCALQTNASLLSRLSLGVRMEWPGQGDVSACESRILQGNSDGTRRWKLAMLDAYNHSIVSCKAIVIWHIQTFDVCDDCEESSAVKNTSLKRIQHCE